MALVARMQSDYYGKIDDRADLYGADAPDPWANTWPPAWTHEKPALSSEPTLPDTQRLQFDGAMRDAALLATRLIATAPAATKPSNPKDIAGSDRLPIHLWPMSATLGGSLALLEGALKYGRSNWRAVGVRASIYYDALQRHMTRWFEGEDIDPDSGLPHLYKAIACLAILIDAHAAGKLEDDRQIEGQYHTLLTTLTPHVARLKQTIGQRPVKHYTIADSAVAARCGS